MARPFKPLAVHELNGTLKNRPGRAARRANEPQVEDGIGNPPKHLTSDAKKVWNELRRTITWLTIADRIVVQMVAKLTVKLNSGDISHREMQFLSSLCSRLGMTPSDRAKVSAQPKHTKAEDEFSFLDAATDSNSERTQ
jgi:phage terminase small subunit